MKSKIQYYLLTFIGCMLFFTTTTLAEQVQIETPKNEQFATITKGKINKKKVKKGDTLKFSFTITNKGLEKIKSDYHWDAGLFSDTKEIGEVCLIWQSSKKQSIQKVYSWKYNKKTKQFKISDKMKIPKGMQQGQWKIREIHVSAGLLSTSEEGDFERIHIYNTNIARNKKDDHPEELSEYIDLSFADFTVRGTGKKIDKEGPVISMKSLKLSKKMLKKGTDSKFSLKVNDKSGMIRKVSCEWIYYVHGVYSANNGEKETYEMNYNKKKKTYECYVYMDLEHRKAKLSYIELEDYYGNKRAYYWEDGGKECYSKKEGWYWSEKGGKEKLGSWERDFNDRYKKYSLKKKDKKALKEMVITRKKKYIKD